MQMEEETIHGKEGEEEESEERRKKFLRKGKKKNDKKTKQQKIQQLKAGGWGSTFRDGNGAGGIGKAILYVLELDWRWRHSLRMR